MTPEELKMIDQINKGLSTLAGLIKELNTRLAVVEQRVAELDQDTSD